MFLYLQHWLVQRRFNNFCQLVYTYWNRTMCTHHTKNQCIWCTQYVLYTMYFDSGVYTVVKWNGILHLQKFIFYTFEEVENGCSPT